MIFFNQFIRITVTEQILNPIIVFAANFKVFQYESKCYKKLTN